MTNAEDVNGEGPETGPLRIPLRNRKGEVVAYALIDPGDAHLAERRWSRDHNGYAQHLVTVAKKTQRRLLLGRVILGLPTGDPRRCDHINGDRLDNRRTNLRIVTHAQNAQNRGPNRNGSSRFRGVSFRKDLKARPWMAYGNVGYKRTTIGWFATEEEAGAAAAAWRAEHMPFAVD